MTDLDKIYQTFFTKIRVPKTKVPNNGLFQSIVIKLCTKIFNIFCGFIYDKYHVARYHLFTPLLKPIENRSCYLTGSVALIIGGEGKLDGELYSPEGQCQHLLAQVSTAFSELWRPVLAYLGGKIMACHSSENYAHCYVYHISNNSWSLLSRAHFTHNHMTGIILILLTM